MAYKEKFNNAFSNDVKTHKRNSMNCSKTPNETFFLSHVTQGIWHRFNKNKSSSEKKADKENRPKSVKFK